MRAWAKVDEIRIIRNLPEPRFKIRGVLRECHTKNSEWMRNETKAKAIKISHLISSVRVVESTATPSFILAFIPCFLRFPALSLTKQTSDPKMWVRSVKCARSVSERFRRDRDTHKGANSLDLSDQQ